MRKQRITIFGKVTQRQLLNYKSQKTKPSLVKEFCSEINNIESVYFIQLSKYLTEDVAEKNLSNPQKEIEDMVYDDVPQLDTDNLVDVSQSKRVRWNNSVAKICDKAHNNVIEYEKNLESNTFDNKFTKLRKIRMKRKRRNMEYMIFHQRMLLHLYQQKLMLYKYYRSKAAIDCNPQVRITWISYAGNMCPKLFRRRFRMTKNCFVRLCRAIVKGVGEEEFKSEAYLEMESKSNTKMG